MSGQNGAQIGMILEMNYEPHPARRTQIINCLIEGNSIRSTERMTDTHRETIMRLLAEVGSGCAKLMDETTRELPCRRIQVEEIWAYVGKASGLQIRTLPVFAEACLGRAAA